MAKAGTSGARGFTFETRFCIFCFVRGFTLDMKNFRLEYQVPEAGKFDDIIFHENGKNYQLIQLKHKESNIKLTHVQLFNENLSSDYNLLKYVKSFIEANRTEKLQNKIKHAIVLTNIPFDLKDDRLDLTRNARPNVKTWYNGLRSLQLLKLTELDDAIVKFTTGEFYKFYDNEDVIQILLKQKEFFPKEAGSLQETEIRDALKYITYAVGQPNDEILQEIIKTDIKDKFKLQNVDGIYNNLEQTFREWCDTKTGALPPIISYEDADNFFQKDVKAVSFDIRAPTTSFTGRLRELTKIREMLHKAGNFVVSQTVKINGLGGIGKTETVRQFIKKYGETDFYGRVIWISAEKDLSVEESFKRLAEKLGIDSDVHVKTLISKVFDYFNGLKTLFVFDNFDEIPGNSAENYVTYCREYVSAPNNKNRPYFLFTSRDKSCLPGVLSVDLGVLSKEQAIKLIQKQLKNCEKHEHEALAETLQYFPLALQQAIAYIKEEASISTYTIETYLEEFAIKKQELLNHKHSDDFGHSHKDTTLITWDVTFDRIQKTKDGDFCIQILKLMAYIYADEIDIRMFVYYFNDEDRVNRAIKLLKRYSLITKTGNSERNVYQIHRLVQAVIQIRFETERKEVLRESMVLISTIDVSDDPTNLSTSSARSGGGQNLHLSNIKSYSLAQNLLEKCVPVFDKILKDREVKRVVSQVNNFPQKLNREIDRVAHRELGVLYGVAEKAKKEVVEKPVDKVKKFFRKL